MPGSGRARIAWRGEREERYVPEGGWAAAAGKEEKGGDVAASSSPVLPSGFLTEQESPSRVESRGPTKVQGEEVVRSV